MAEEIKPREIVFGELYEDDSGYRWRVALEGIASEERRVVIGEGDYSQSIDPLKTNIRDVANALNQIADLLGEPQ